MRRGQLGDNFSFLAITCLCKHYPQTTYTHKQNNQTNNFEQVGNRNPNPPNTIATFISNFQFKLTQLTPKTFWRLTVRSIHLESLGNTLSEYFCSACRFTFDHCMMFINNFQCRMAVFYSSRDSFSCLHYTDFLIYWFLRNKRDWSCIGGIKNIISIPGSGRMSW